MEVQKVKKFVEDMKDQILDLEKLIEDFNGKLLQNQSQLFYCPTCNTFLDGYDIIKKEFRGLRLSSWDSFSYRHSNKSGNYHDLIIIISAEQLRKILNLTFNY